jgi:hypothetical protein
MVLQTSVVCPVFESITVFTGRQLQVTVLAFSCLTTTQCSITSALGGGIWLRIGGGVAAIGCFLAAQPARNRHNTSPAFFMLSVFALPRPLVDGKLGYSPAAGAVLRVIPACNTSLALRKVAIMLSTGRLMQLFHCPRDVQKGRSGREISSVRGVSPTLQRRRFQQAKSNEPLRETCNG